MTRFVAWPGLRHLGYAARLSAAVSLLFLAVYAGADWFTGRRTTHLQLYLQSELAIPFWPAAIVVYDSLYLLFLLAPFVLRTRASFRHLAVSAVAVILIAGCLFLLFPAELGFVRAAVSGPFQPIFDASDRLNLDYNLVPSLHVALAAICLQAFWPSASGSVRAGLAMWGTALALSTLFTHQHHLLDVGAGALLAFVAFPVCGRFVHVS